MSEFIDLTGLDDSEAEAASAAVVEFRKERERLAEEARRRGTPTWKNTIHCFHTIGYRELHQLARDLGYTFYEWNGWVYAVDLPLIEQAVCLTEALDSI